jgi:hypothetical protein
MRLIAILLVFCLAAPAAAQTPAERERLDRALQRGRLIFEIDRAAWVTTDDIRAHRGDVGAVRGWTVERDGTGYAVTYFAGEGDVRPAVYRGRVENNRVVSREVFSADTRPPLTAVQRRLADARRAVGLMNQRPCTNAPFNAVVIPPATPDEPAEVYALTAQTDSTSYPFGGHFLGRISAAGELLSQRAFTRACLNMLPQPPAGNQPAALVVSHLLDPTPTEIHVFMSIWVALPVYVLTGDRTWEVTGDRIRLVDPRN